MAVHIVLMSTNDVNYLKSISRYFDIFIVLFETEVSTTGMHRRQIVDTMDSNVKSKSSCYVVTADNRYLMACGFWDKSFRVFLTDTCKKIK